LLYTLVSSFFLYFHLFFFFILPFHYAGENHNRRGIRTNAQLQPRESIHNKWL
jgi:hypothetical protein